MQLPGGHHPGIVAPDRLVATESAPRPRPGQAGGGALLDQPPLELGRVREDVEHQLELARCRSRVDGAVLQGPEADSLTQ